MKNIVILGATSAIAHAAAQVWAQQGHAFFLLGRNEILLRSNADDLCVRGAAAAHVLAMDLAKPSLDCQDIIITIDRTMNGIDYVLLAYGILGCQEGAREQRDELNLIIETNYSSAIRWLLALRQFFLRKPCQGTWGVITSVAGDRGRASNYIYGSTKGGLSTFLSGLNCELGAMGIHVIDLKPGFIDTPMTSHMAKGHLWSEPQSLGYSIVKAFEQKTPVVYLPWFWRYIMLVFKHIPHLIFKKLKI